MVAAGEDGLALIGGLQLAAPISRRVHPTLSGGAIRQMDGTVAARDAAIDVRTYLVNEPSIVVRVTPGLTVPLGAVSTGLTFSGLSTGSVDPRLAATVVAGGTWLVAANGVVRVSLYPGFDSLTQGVFGRVDLRVARRLGEVAVWAGISGAARAGSPTNGIGAFSELAPIAGATVPLSDRSALSANARVPVFNTPDRPYAVALGIGLSTVIGKAPGGDDAH